ncbi:hypothetical protein EG68_04614 [Paragonimus skrjabini miyazakii]|uniref:BZIP domain-containing protein n=1 Tax=Paragonimus skrjabini miyazakii TaxID=59628 RepID=A0A8S9YTS2_9TREM|nr:hypothetical protein EG68_04614 [Paragonimus skrjabini miyazakii]
MALVHAFPMEAVSVDPVVGMDDAIDGLFDSVGLLDGFELANLDLPVSNTDVYRESSDSDSGISISCDNSVLDGAHITEPFVYTATSDDVRTGVDRVLTDVMCDIVPSSIASPSVCSSEQPRFSPHYFTANKTAASQNPVCIVKITSDHPVIGRKLNVKIPEQLTGQSLKNLSNVLPKRIFNPSSVVLSNGVTAPRATCAKMIKHPLGGVRASLPIYKEESEDLPSDILNEFDVSTFLDDYDPISHADSYLEKHLRDFCGKTFLDENVHVGSSSSTETYMASNGSRAMDTCLLSRASLDRLRKKQERMIKNRHAASMSRLRKKEYLERLEMRYEQLKRENLNLWRQNEEWRTRCENLEHCLNELQTRLTDSSSAAQTPVDNPTVDSYDPPELVVTRCHPVPTCLPIGSCKRPPVLTPSFSSSTSSSTSFLTGSTQSGLISSARMSLTTVCAQSSRCVPGTSDRQFTHIKFGHKPSKCSDQPNDRKTVLNSVFYSGKGGCTTSNTIHTPTFSLNSGSVVTAVARKPMRQNLANLTGLISRNRPGNHFYASRSKLVATTSLFGLLCLFSLNTILPPLTFKRPDGELASIQPQSPSEGWRTLPSHPAGHRILLNVPTSLDSLDDVVPCSVSSDKTQENVNWTTGNSPCSPDKTVLPDQKDTKTELDAEGLGNFSRWQSNIAASDDDVSVISSVPSDTNGPSANGSQRARRVIRTRGSQYPGSKSFKQNSNELPNKTKARNSDDKPCVTESSDKSSSLQALHTSRFFSVKSFFRRPVWDTKHLVAAAGRRNDTVYLILPQLDSKQLHIVNPDYEHLATRITLIVPAYPSNIALNTFEQHNSTDPFYTMLQVDCELRNVSLIPSPTRPGR